ncbi:MAG: hypothetical protein AAF710_06465 [Planctomycetota bacterium]
MSRAPIPSSAPILDRLGDALPGWMFVAAGLTLLAAVVLTPPWLAQHEASWRLRVMQAQAAAHAEQAERYQRFAAAVADDDPVVLERLALTHLRMTLAGKQPLRVTTPDRESGDVGAWLAVPQPVVGRDLPAYAPPDRRVVRLLDGAGRPALLLVGLTCLVAGVLFNPRSGSGRGETAPTRPKAGSRATRFRSGHGHPRPPRRLGPA